jgi:homoserine dehydrogenase
VIAALVRDPGRPRDVLLARDAVVTGDAAAVLARRPDVVVEVLGGVEPAYSLVTRALAAAVPVVTANKSLLAAHGPALLTLAARAGVPFRYEASVVAGVPFLGALASQSASARATRIQGIVNGTSNAILTAMRTRGDTLERALAEAQRLGLAEPDPASDTSGLDAAEKLAVLALHLGWGALDARTIERDGVEALRPIDFEQAGEFGGTIKPLAFAERRAEGLTAFVGPAFVPASHPLARIDGVENAVRLRTPDGELLFAGPGAGPDVTAATVIDDALEAAAGRSFATGGARPVARAIAGTPPTPWFVRIAGRRLPAAEDIADFLGSYGIWLRRTSAHRESSGREHTHVLTHRIGRERLTLALAALGASAGCDSLALRVVED